MNFNETNRNGSRGVPIEFEQPTESGVSEVPPLPTNESTGPETKNEWANVPTVGFATRADAKGTDGMVKSKLVFLGGGLAIAVLFFVFTAIVGKSPKKETPYKPTTQPAKQETKQPKGSVTPVMETVRTPAPDNSSGQLGPGDIRRTRSSDGAAVAKANSELAQKPEAAKRAAVGSLGNVPSFSDTQQRWEEPQPYGESVPASTSQTQQQQNVLKEPSLVFVRSQLQNQTTATVKSVSDGEGRPLLDIAPGTRILAKLQSQISSVVQDRVVAEVEYTYAIGDKIIIPAGARIYGQLVQADRSGLVNVKFDEIELKNQPSEKIEAIGLGLDLGPIKGVVSGKNTGKNFLVRTASGISSVATMLVGNNNSSTFSEDDLLRERIAQNIGNAGDTEVMSLMTNSRVIVSVPADTKIYIVFTKHEVGSPTLHKVPTNQ